MTNPVDFARLTDASGAYGKNIMQGVAHGIVAYYEGRDLPPVVHPDQCSTSSAGIFDLGGKAPAQSGGGNGGDSGSAWDTSNGQTADDSASTPPASTALRIRNPINNPPIKKPAIRNLPTRRRVKIPTPTKRIASKVGALIVFGIIIENNPQAR